MDIPGAVLLEPTKGYMPEIDYERLGAEVSKALLPQIAQAAGNGGVGGIMPTPPLPSSPFAQSGLPMDSPLPRVGNTFTSQFGPGYPYWPQPLDYLGPEELRAPPRRFEYPVAWNLQLLDREVPWSMLTQLANQCDIISRCIMIQIDTVCGLDFDFTVTNAAVRAVQAEDPSLSYSQASAQVQKQYMAEIDRARSFWEMPDRDMGMSFSDFISALLWDHFTYDAVAIYPRLNLDGTLRNLELLDGGSIKLYLDDQGRRPRFPNPAFGQYLWGFIRGEFQWAEGEADSEMYLPLDELPDEFRRDQLAYYMRRPRNRFVYGFSAVEEAIPIAITYLARQAWMRSEYEDGSTPLTWLKIGGPEGSAWTPQQFAAYENVVNAKLSGLTGNRHRIRLIRGDFEPVQMSQIDEHYKADYDTFLITQLGSKFGVSPSQLGIQPRSGLSGGRQLEGEAQQAETMSIKPLTEWLVDKINDLSRRFLGIDPVITAKFGEGGNDQDELNNAKRDQILVMTGQKTLNDLRGERGDPLYDIPEADEPMIVTATGPVFVSGEFEAARDAANEPTPTGGAEEAGAAGADPGQGVGDTSGGSGPTVTQQRGKTGTDDDVRDKESGPIPASKTGEPGQENEAQKAAELARFTKFASTRTRTGHWRDFEFTHADPRTARLLNYLGSVGDLDSVKILVSDEGKAAPKARARVRATTGA